MGNEEIKFCSHCGLKLLACKCNVHCFTEEEFKEAKKEINKLISNKSMNGLKKQLDEDYEKELIRRAKTVKFFSKEEILKSMNNHNKRMIETFPNCLQ